MSGFRWDRELEMVGAIEGDIRLVLAFGFRRANFSGGEKSPLGFPSPEGFEKLRQQLGKILLRFELNLSIEGKFGYIAE